MKTQNKNPYVNRMAPKTEKIAVAETKIIHPAIINKISKISTATHLCNNQLDFQGKLRFTPKSRPPRNIAQNTRC